VRGSPAPIIGSAVCRSWERHRFRHRHSAVPSGEETATWAPPAALEAILVLLHA
jgi:hypothetical protein